MEDIELLPLRTKLALISDLTDDHIIEISVSKDIPIPLGRKPYFPEEIKEKAMDKGISTSMIKHFDNKKASKSNIILMKEKNNMRRSLIIRIFIENFKGKFRVKCKSMIDPNLNNEKKSTKIDISSEKIEGNLIQILNIQIVHQAEAHTKNLSGDRGINQTFVKKSTEIKVIEILIIIEIEKNREDKPCETVNKMIDIPTTEIEKTIDKGNTAKSTIEKTITPKIRKTIAKMTEDMIEAVRKHMNQNTRTEDKLKPKIKGINK